MFCQKNLNSFTNDMNKEVSKDEKSFTTVLQQA